MIRLTPEAMKWKTLLGAALLFSLGIFTGCESTDVLKPNGEVAVSLDAAKKKGSTSVLLANIITLTLPPTQPGFSWQIAFHDTRYLKQTTDIVPSKTGEEGSKVSFLAINTGSTRLRFLLVPVSGGASAIPTDQQEVTVKIQ
jgi:hypothetical protein